MASASLGKKSYYNKLQAYRLEANKLKITEQKKCNCDNKDSKSDNKDSRSYLYSLNLQNAHWNGENILTFEKSGVDLITFTDRPFRDTSKNTDVNSIDELNRIFNEGKEADNSFAKDPPNAVMVTQDGQDTFIVEKVKVENGKVTMTLKDLRGQNKLPEVTGRITLFIDNFLMGNVYFPFIISPGGKKGYYNTLLDNSRYEYGLLNLFLPLLNMCLYKY